MVKVGKVEQESQRREHSLSHGQKDVVDMRTSLLLRFQKHHSPTPSPSIVISCASTIF